MRSNDLINFLKKKFKLKTDQELRRALGLSQMTLDNWRKRKSLSARIVGEQIARLASGRLAGAAVIRQLQGHFDASSLSSLAKKVGVTNQAIQNWKNREVVTARQVAGLARSASRAGAVDLQTNAIRPLVEFFRIDKCDSPQKAKFELFSAKENGHAKVEHPYRAGLKRELAKHVGVYVFFDSRGQAIYAGKARRQTLWTELNLAYNRDRGRVQNIMRVRHPENRVKYRTSEEKARQIQEAVVPLHELAAYFSAYQVADSMIEDLEALLVRSFANDLLNIRMEKFTRQRKKQK